MIQLNMPAKNIGTERHSLAHLRGARQGFLGRQQNLVLCIGTMEYMGRIL